MENLLSKEDIVGREIKEVKSIGELDIYIFDDGVYIKDFRNRILDENTIRSTISLEKMLELGIINNDEYNYYNEEEKRKYKEAQQKKNEFKIKSLKREIENLQHEIEKCHNEIKIIKEKGE